MRETGYESQHHGNPLIMGISGSDYLRTMCFVHIYQAQKEAKESLYWLQLIDQSSLVPKNSVTSLIQETNEIIAIITTIIKNTKNTI